MVISMEMVFFMILIIVGGMLGTLLKIPAGALVGPLFLVGSFKAANILNLNDVPQIVRWGSQACLGMMLGLLFSRDIIAYSKKMLGGILFVGVVSVLSALLIGFVVYQLTDLSLITAIIATVPGGLPEMLTLASSVEANTQAVAMFQLMRIIVLMLVVPVFLRMIYKRFRSEG